jgi:hypothetical protein
MAVDVERDDTPRIVFHVVDAEGKRIDWSHRQLWGVLLRGGIYWWYFVEEVMPDNALYRTLKSGYTKVHVGKATALHRLP